MYYLGACEHNRDIHIHLKTLLLKLIFKTTNHSLNFENRKYNKISLNPNAKYHKTW